MHIVGKGRTVGKFCSTRQHFVRANNSEQDLIIGTMISNLPEKTIVYETEEENENGAWTDRSDLCLVFRNYAVCIRTTNADRNNNGNDCANPYE